MCDDLGSEAFRVGQDAVRLTWNFVHIGKFQGNGKERGWDVPRQPSLKPLAMMRVAPLASEAVKPGAGRRGDFQGCIVFNIYWDSKGEVRHGLGRSELPCTGTYGRRDHLDDRFFHRAPEARSGATPCVGEDGHMTPRAGWARRTWLYPHPT